ncbi:MAG: cytochrome oxidase subunit III [Armatimonadetes bacterium]|nr:cytochrome oxidase subunit III [Armatimonadota bacterium]
MSDALAVPHGHGHGHGHEHDHEVGCTGLHHRKIMMWAFLGSDCMFFGSLIATYVAYVGKSPIPPVPYDVFDLNVTSISTFVLLMSSLMMVLCLSAIQRNDIKWFRVWCAMTAFFGLIFLGFQYYEFSHFVSRGLTLKSSLFGSTFFVLTGTHGTHVAIGVLWLLSMLFFSYRTGFGRERALDVEIAGLYWHFVDIVWIVIFTVVYIVEFVVGHPGG